MPIIEELFNIIAPHECLGCRKEGSLLCYDCGLTVEAPPMRCYVCGRWDDASRTCQACRRRTPIHSLWAAVTYNGLPKKLLHQLKFERARAGVIPAAALLAARCHSQPDMMVTHVPTANRRIRERGYDQAELLAKALAKRLNLPYAPSLIRLGEHRQVGAVRAIRKQQMEGVFRPVNQALIQKQYVLLVDDVLTTGATCEEAARVLRRSGARRVSAAVFAVA